LGEEIKAKDLNDDKLGRVLDKLYKVGLTRHWFSLIEGRKLYWVCVREKRSQYKLRRK
jgi:hypothetical protein